MKHSVTQEGDATVLHVAGELDAVSSPELRPVLDKLVEDGKLAVTVDLSDLRLIDSSGVGALVSLYKRIRSSGGAVRFVGLIGQPLVIFKLLRLDRAFQIS